MGTSASQDYILGSEEITFFILFTLLHLVVRSG